MQKRGTINISVNAVVIIILAIVVLGLCLGIIKGMFGKTTVKFEELLSKEPEPQEPYASEPITLSREAIRTKAGKTEALKIGVFNPTNKDWTFRDPIEDDERLCGIDGDNICYINSWSFQEGICNNDTNAIVNDNDCSKLDNHEDHDEPIRGDGHLTNIECDDEGGILTMPPEGICFIDNMNCYEFEDPDCAPTDGVRLSIECGNELNLKTQTNPKTIEAGESTTFTALLEIKKNTPKGTYLCNIAVVGGGRKEVMKDLSVGVG